MNAFRNDGSAGGEEPTSTTLTQDEEVDAPVELRPLTPFSMAAVAAGVAQFEAGNHEPVLMRISPPELWYDAFEDHALQRRIDLRLINRKRELRHLETFEAPMVEVKAVYNAETKKITKLGGHTRAYLQKHKLVPYRIPYFNLALVYASNQTASNKLYKIENGHAAGDNARNVLESSLQEAGMLFPEFSPLLIEGKIAGAIKFADGLVRQREYHPLGLKQFLDLHPATQPQQLKRLSDAYYEIDLLDVRSGLPLELTTALFFTIDLLGEPAVYFWDHFFKTKGEKWDSLDGDRKNAVKMLRDARLLSMDATSALDKLHVFIPLAITAILEWDRNKPEAEYNAKGALIKVISKGTMRMKWHKTNDAVINALKAKRRRR